MRCCSAEQLKRLSESSALAAVRASVITLLLYNLFAAVFFTNVEGWTTFEAIYFSMVTMSTVGFGDLSPTVWYSQAVGVAFILVGIILVFGQIGGVMALFVKPLFDGSRELVDSLWESLTGPPEFVQFNDEIGHHKIPAPRRPLIFYTKGLVGPIVILLAFQLLSAAIFIWVEPEWDLQKALWYVMVTATTVGYGDVSVSTSNEWGLVWASLHILLSVSLLAALIEDVTALKEERKELLTQVFQFKKCHEKETLSSLDLDHSGELTQNEFILGMLQKIGKIDKDKDIEPIKMMFSGIDINHDGKIDVNCLETHEGRMKKKLRKLDDYVQKELAAMEVKHDKQLAARASICPEDPRDTRTATVAPEPPTPSGRAPPLPPLPPPYPPPDALGHHREHHNTWVVTW